MDGYLLDNFVEGPLQLIVSGGQLPEVPMRLQDGKDNLVHLVHRLEQTPLNRRQRTIRDVVSSPEHVIKWAVRTWFISMERGHLPFL